MTHEKTLGERLSARGLSRRSLLKYAAYTASIMALPPTAATAIAQGIAQARRCLLYTSDAADELR